MDRRVVITGMGVVTSLGDTIEDFWTNLLAGKDVMKKSGRFDTSRYRSQVTTVLDYEHHDRKDACGDHRDTHHLCSRVGLRAAEQAIRSAGLTDNGQYKKAGISIGTTSGGEIEAYVKWYHCGGPMDDVTVKNSAVFMSMTNLADALDLEGPVCNISSACTSGTVSIAYAYELIRSGDADVMLAGGCDILQESAFAGFNSLRVVTPDQCRPFSLGRKGMMIGDGAAMLILEDYESAVRRNAPILAEMIGAGMSCDAHHVTAPNALGAAQAIELALHDAGLTPRDIDYINCHGTGTVLNDRGEAQALTRVFGDHIQKLYATSTKSCLGHLLGTAGSIEAVITTLAIVTDTIPPMMNVGATDPTVEFAVVENSPLHAKVNRAMSNSFGFGGNNASIILSKASNGKDR